MTKHMWTHQTSNALKQEYKWNEIMPKIISTLQFPTKGCLALCRRSYIKHWHRMHIVFDCHDNHLRHNRNKSRTVNGVLLRLCRKWSRNNKNDDISMSMYLRYIAGWLPPSPRPPLPASGHPPPVTSQEPAERRPRQRRRHENITIRRRWESEVYRASSSTNQC